jgi:hypothetical protein
MGKGQISGRSFAPTWSERQESTHPSIWVLGLAHLRSVRILTHSVLLPAVRTVYDVWNVRVIFVLISSYEQKNYLNKFKIGTIFELDKFRI